MRPNNTYGKRALAGAGRIFFWDSNHGAKTKNCDYAANVTISILLPSGSRKNAA